MPSPNLSDELITTALPNLTEQLGGTIKRRDLAKHLSTLCVRANVCEAVNDLSVELIGRSETALLMAVASELLLRGELAKDEAAGYFNTALKRYLSNEIYLSESFEKLAFGSHQKRKSAPLQDDPSELTPAAIHSRLSQRGVNMPWLDGVIDWGVFRFRLKKHVANTDGVSPQVLNDAHETLAKLKGGKFSPETVHAILRLLTVEADKAPGNSALRDPDEYFQKLVEWYFIDPKTAIEQIFCKPYKPIKL